MCAALQGDMCSPQRRYALPLREMCAALQGDVRSPPRRYVQPSKEICAALQLFHLHGLVGTWVAVRSLRLAVLSGRV